MSFFTVLVLATLLATVAALATGISSMVADRQVAHADSVHWMARRVEFQAVAILLLLVAVYLAG
jgi:hypothetical protein